MSFGMMELLFALIVLGLGYIVLQSAGRSEGSMRGLGNTIGRVMIIVSAILIILDLYILTNVIVRSITGQRAQPVQQERVVKAPPVPRAPVR